MRSEYSSESFHRNRRSDSLGYRVIEKNAGVVHQYVEPLEFFDSEIDALLGRMFVRNIRAKSDCFTAIVTNRLRDIFDWIVRQSANYYTRTFLGELMRVGFTVVCA